MKSGTKFFFNIVLVILAGVASWKLYFLIDSFFGDMFISIGITNIYVQGFIFIGLVLGTLYLIGKKTLVWESLR